MSQFIDYANKLSHQSRHLCLWFESHFCWRLRLFCFFGFTVDILFHRGKNNKKSFLESAIFFLSKKLSTFEKTENVLCMFLLIKLHTKFHYSAKQIKVLPLGSCFLFFCSLKECVDGGRTSVIVQYLLFSNKRSQCSKYVPLPKVSLFCYPPPPSSSHS